MVRKGEGSYAKKDAELDMLHRVVAYCLNEVDCRRKVVLEHFGEHFNAADCRGTCDNCGGGFVVEAKDLTQHAQKVVRLFSSVTVDGRHNSYTNATASIFNNVPTPPTKRARSPLQTRLFNSMLE